MVNTSAMAMAVAVVGFIVTKINATGDFSTTVAIVICIVIAVSISAPLPLTAFIRSHSSQGYPT